MSSSTNFPRLIPLALGLLACASLVGCQRGAEEFALLDANKDGLLTAAELDVNQDGTVAPEEVQFKGTYTRKLQQFMVDGGSADDQKLTPAEFDRALLGQRMPGWVIGLIVLAVVGIPVPLGFQLGNSLRMPDHGWKIALVLLTVTAAGAITYFGWPPKRGIDLSGGVILIYEIDEQATIQQGVAADDKNEDALRDDERIDIDDVVAALRRRVNPGGVKEVVIRPYGSRQVEIIVPEIEEAEVDYIKELIQRTGQLEFLIVANARDHQEVIGKALSPESLPQRETNVEQAGAFKGRWVPVGVEERQRDKEPSYHGVNLGDVLRARKGDNEGFGRPEIPDDLIAQINSEEKNLKQALDQLGYRDLQVLMVVNPTDRFNIRGQHLRSASKWVDGSLNPAVNFSMKPDGAALLETLTSANLPSSDKQFFRRMGIIMDGELISAPRLNDVIGREGQITGNFTDQEVDFLVNILRAGRLPAVLRKEPISQNEVSALLGDDTIRRGGIAIGSSLLITLLFMLYYYRFAGAVACISLLLNLLFTIAAMIAIRAAFTLPGIAGLVLGVGMSVDANILIFERIREEMSHGAGLRTALRNGFSRAATTIIDSNMTTLITALVLYGIGTEQIKGFAVTLILGLIISMFTAIFCARVVFDVFEKQRWITKLSMSQWITQTSIDFIGKQRLAIGGSILIIAIGMGALFSRGKNIFDIDFNGGTSVQLLFKEAQPIELVRSAVDSSDITDPTVTLVRVEGYDAGRVYQVDSSITGEEKPAVGDPVLFAPPGAATASPFTIAALNVEKQTADLVAEAGDTKAAGVKWSSFQRDGVGILQQQLIKVFADKLEQRSLVVADVRAIDKGDASSPPNDRAEPDNGTPPSSDDLAPPADDKPAETPAAENPPTETPPADDAQPAETPPTDKPATDTPAEPAPPAPSDTPPATDPAAPASDAPPAEPSAVPPEEEEGAAITRAGLVYTSFQEPSEAVAETTSDPAPPATTEESVPPPTPPSDEGVPAATPEAGVVNETTTPEVVVVKLGSTKAQLQFGHPVNSPTVTAAVMKAAASVLGVLNLPGVKLDNAEWDGSPGQRFKNWEVELPLDQPTAQRVLDSMQQDLQGTPVWLSSNKIGPQIAGELTERALASLIFATIGIIGYIWFRFHRVVFGIAAVIAMVHDVIITVGFIGLSYYLATFLGFLGVDEFKINMTIIAAILTVIGYSLNDTVVVFDRIREVRGKNPDLTVAMVNQSVNQTLSRTLLTSFTTILSLVVMYAIGGPSIRGFAYTLLVGLVVGTFSSVYIASPCLLWLMKVSKQVPNRPEKVKPADLTRA